MVGLSLWRFLFVLVILSAWSGARQASAQASFRINDRAGSIPVSGYAYFSVSLNASVPVDIVVQVSPVTSNTVWTSSRRNVPLRRDWTGNRLIGLRVALRRALRSGSKYTIIFTAVPVGFRPTQAYHRVSLTAEAVPGGCNPASAGQFISPLSCSVVEAAARRLPFKYAENMKDGSLGGLKDGFRNQIGFSAFIPPRNNSVVPYDRSLVVMGKRLLYLRSVPGDWMSDEGPLVNALAIPLPYPGSGEDVIMTVRVRNIGDGKGAGEKFCIYLARRDNAFVRICVISRAAGRCAFVVESVEGGQRVVTRSRRGGAMMSRTDMTLRMIVLRSLGEVVLEYALEKGLSFSQHSRVAVTSRLLMPGSFLGISGSSGSMDSASWGVHSFEVVEDAGDPIEYDCTPIPSEFSGAPISTLDCSQVVISPPLNLLFGSSSPGESLEDSDGRGTGFTAFVPSGSLSKSFDPSRFRVRSQTLELESYPGDWEGGRDNNLVNALGVLLPLPESNNIVNVTAKLPEDITRGRGEKLCLFLASSDRDFVWVCALAASRGGSAVLRFWQEEEDQRKSVLQRVVPLSSARTVSLSLRIQREPNRVDVLYQTTGTWSRIVRREISEMLVNGDQASIDPRVGSRATSGIVASSGERDHSEMGPSVWSVESFSVENFAIDKRPPKGQPPMDQDDLDFDVWEIEDIKLPTSMVFAPDGQLYVASSSGEITALRVDHDRQQVLERRTFTGVSGRDRLLVGLTTDPDWSSSEATRCLWLSHASGLRNGNERANSGRISKLCGRNFSELTDMITGLPCADVGHSTNNIRFDSEGKLFIAQGGNTGAGSTNMIINGFYFPEQRLSAAILVADVKRQGFRGDCLPPQSRRNMEMTRIATQQDAANCDVEVYATGLRNAFDIVFHPNGHLYSADNAVGVGGQRAYPTLPTGWQQGDDCRKPQETREEIRESAPGQRADLLLDVERGAYYGHPNPSRDECVFYGGNPTSQEDFRFPMSPVQTGEMLSLEDSNYPVGQRPQGRALGARPFRSAMMGFGYGRSANALIAYRSKKFCGQMTGDLLVTYFATDPQVRRITLSPDGKTVARDSPLRRTTRDTGGNLLQTPLGIEQDREGNLFVGQYRGTKITVMTAKDTSC